MRDFFADKTIVKKDFRVQRLPKGDYENCHFQDCQFQEGFLDNQNFVECVFQDCDLTNANIAHTQFNEVTFKGCKLVGIHFETCDQMFSRLQFEGSNLSLSSFFEMDMSNTLFKNCKLHQVDFANTNLSDVVFEHCDLADAVFDGSHLERADFTSGINFTIDPSKNGIKKAKFTKEGLIGLLKKYDIVIE